MNTLAPRITVKIIIPIAALAVSVFLFVFGMMQQPYTAYAFPELFVAAMIVFSLAWIGEELLFAPKDTGKPTSWGAVVWGILLMISYLTATQFIGFRWSSLLVFVIVGVGYSPIPGQVKNAVITVLSGILFMVVIYALFELLLKVQVPTVNF